MGWTGPNNRRYQSPPGRGWVGLASISATLAGAVGVVLGWLHLRKKPDPGKSKS
jgi:hypothetical protein